MYKSPGSGPKGIAQSTDCAHLKYSNLNSPITRIHVPLGSKFQTLSRKNNPQRTQHASFYHHRYSCPSADDSYSCKPLRRSRETRIQHLHILLQASAQYLRINFWLWMSLLKAQLSQSRKTSYSLVLSGSPVSQSPKSMLTENQWPNNPFNLEVELSYNAGSRWERLEWIKIGY